MNGRWRKSLWTAEEPKYLVVIIGDQSQRDSKLDWSLICYNFYFLTQQQKFRQSKKGKKCVCCWKMLMGFACKTKNVSLWFANSANYTQKMWSWRISVGIEYSIIDTHPFWQFFRALNRMLETAKTNNLEYLITVHMYG